MEQERIRRSPSVRASVSTDGLVLLDLDAGLVLSANAVGARIWQLIEEDWTTSEIARQVAQDFGKPLDRVERDVSLFVGELMSRGLVAGDPPR